MMTPLLSKPQDFQLDTLLGYRIFGKHFRSRLPSHTTIILCPPAKQNMDYFLNDPLFRWRKWLFLGFDVLLFDPLGCGDSWGTVDWGGTEDQETLNLIFKHLEPEQKKIVILSFGLSTLTMLKIGNPHPLMAFEPLLKPEEIIQSHPELQRKPEHFWIERSLPENFAPDFPILSTSRSCLRSRIRREKMLLEILLH